MKKINVILNRNDKRWKEFEIDFEKIIKKTLSKYDNKAEVSIILTNDKEIQKLNKKYRSINKPTNVLSFETGDSQLLGDIYISFDTVWNEAEQDKDKFINHACHMAVHGALHLDGYKHGDDKEARAMEQLEVLILKSFGIQNPYLEKISPIKKPSNLKGKGVKVKMNKITEITIYALLGLFASLGFAPFNFWFAAFIGIMGAYYLSTKNLDASNTKSIWKSFLKILPFSAAYSIGMFWWILNSIFVVPELASQFAIWTVPGIIGIGITGGIFFAIPFVVIQAMRMSSAHRAIMFPTIWVLVLWAREWILTGFPWNPIANILMPFPVISNSMSLWGALGLSFIIVGIIATVTELFNKKENKRLRFPIVIFAALLMTGAIAGYKNIKDTEKIKSENSPVIRIVQPAKSASEKASHSREQAIKNAEKNIENLVKLAKEKEGKYDVIIFPETSYPFLIVSNEFAFSKNFDVPVIIGASTYKENQFFNSLLIANTAGTLDKIYSKSHLVPFGEYRPFGNLVPTPGMLTPGNGAEIIKIKLGEKDLNFAPAICYEIVFSDSLVPKGLSPQLVINITNDTWFGKTPGSYQHLDMVRRYAIESGLPIIRSNYSGISAFISADGEVISSLPIGMAGTLDGTYEGAHMTMYRKLGRDTWMIIILAFATICLISISGFEKKD